jgi:hypothetical protein
MSAPCSTLEHTVITIADISDGLEASSIPCTVSRRFDDEGDGNDVERPTLPAALFASGVYAALPLPSSLISSVSIASSPATPVYYPVYTTECIPSAPLQQSTTATPSSSSSTADLYSRGCQRGCLCHAASLSSAVTTTTTSPVTCIACIGGASSYAPVVDGRNEGDNGGDHAGVDVCGGDARLVALAERAACACEVVDADDDDDDDDDVNDVGVGVATAALAASPSSLSSSSLATSSPFDAPLFECGDSCACVRGGGGGGVLSGGGGCVNRVVQRGMAASHRLEVRRSCIDTGAGGGSAGGGDGNTSGSSRISGGSGDGWGVFTTRRILAGTFVCCYVGERIDVGEAVRRRRVYDKIGVNYVLTLRELVPAVLAAEDATARRSPKRRRVGDVDAGSRAVFDSGVVWSTIIDATRCGGVARYVNHSCDPCLVGEYCAM